MSHSHTSGDTTYTNRLIHETSPYLLQHAHNPVDWYPWGDEALAKAREESKPIHLSIGYSACHWCHVLAHESFEDPQTAAILNQHFVNIKVDREERPDLDAIYMQAVQALTGHGGWPMTTFLTPDGKPFYGGTYFPPVPRYGMPSFQQVLLGVANLWEQERDKALENATSLTAHLVAATQIPSGDNTLTPALLDEAWNTIRSAFDSHNGGFGQAPKFPQPQSLDFALRQYQRTKDIAALAVAETSLLKMARGGIYDQVGGGFHRYSVDERWLVPHFEKMLYDNAQLARVFLHAYQVTQTPFYRQIVEETLDYVVREMTDPVGGFYSTQDADSEGEEGKFFVWTAEEIRALLGKDASIFMALYDVSSRGNWEGKTILNQPREPEAVAGVLGVSLETVLDVAQRGRRILYEAREGREHPGRDDKVLVAWNGLMVAAFAEAGRVLHRQDYIDVATRNAHFVTEQMVVDGKLQHVYMNGVARIDAFLEDYAIYAEGLLELYRATWDVRWFKTAHDWADTILEHFWDHEAGGFFQTSDDHEQLIARPKDLFDEAVPSGNGVAASLLLQLAALTGESMYDQRARATIGIVAPALGRSPTAFGKTLNALDFALGEPQEIAIIGVPNAPDTAAMIDVLNRRFLPNTVAAIASPDDPATTTIPLLRDRPQQNGAATAYVCRSFACEAPTTDVAHLERLIV